MHRGAKSEDQRGLASIIIATVLMVVMSLITLGFTRIMQREQRQSLDRILSSQAFYAAESGVNDAYSIIGTLGDKTNCDVSSFPNGGVLDTTENGVKYSCVLVDKSPTSIEYNNSAITTAQSKIVSVEAATAINSITFEWSGTSVSPALPNSNCADLPVSSAWGSRPPLLKLDLVQIPTVSFSREGLISLTQNMYLAPSLSGSCSSVSTNPISDHVGEANKGKIVPVSCTSGGTYHCSFTLTGLTANRYVARVRPIYATADKVRITAENSTSPGVDLELVGAQAIIDSTGRANDVVRRIQVRVPLVSEYPLPEFVLQAMDGVCKQLSYAPPSTVSYPCPL